MAKEETNHNLQLGSHQLLTLEISLQTACMETWIPRLKKHITCFHCSHPAVMCKTASITVEMCKEQPFNLLWDEILKLTYYLVRPPGTIHVWSPASAAHSTYFRRHGMKEVPCFHRKWSVSLKQISESNLQMALWISSSFTRQRKVSVTEQNNKAPNISQIHCTQAVKFIFP